MNNHSPQVAQSVKIVETLGSLKLLGNQLEKLEAAKAV